MDQFQHIDVASAAKLLDQDKAVIWDIRDPQSFALSHPQGAAHLTNDTMLDLTNSVDDETAILVICYHGNSSQGAAQYLVNQGFETVYSVDGGFEAWKKAGLACES